MTLPSLNFKIFFILLILLTKISAHLGLSLAVVRNVKNVKKHNSVQQLFEFLLYAKISTLPELVI